MHAARDAMARGCELYGGLGGSRARPSSSRRVTGGALGLRDSRRLQMRARREAIAVSLA